MTTSPDPALAPAPLCDDALADHEGRPNLQVPSYDRVALTPGVVHLSVGGFHRAHQAVYFEELAELGETDWGVVGVGLHSPEMHEVLDAQDGLFTVVERSADDDRGRIVGCVLAHVQASDEPGAVLDLLTAETTRLVTMTITGDGYRVDRRTGAFDADDDEVRWDLEHPEAPRGALGFVVEALDRRRRAGTRPFTVLSCDNVPDNGRITRAAVVGFARLRDDALASWIDGEVGFPDSMVDRITPSTSVEDRERIQDDLGVGDGWPVITEPFRQWVIQDAFCNERPPLERVGVQVVDDVGPFQTVKKRVLNGTHCVIGHLGSLAGLDTADEVMADPDLGRFVVRLIHEELLSLLPTPPGMDLREYADRTVERLSNERMGDDLTRLSRRGSRKMVDYLLPSVAEAVRGEGPHALLVLSVAAWIRYLGGTADDGTPLDVEDARRDELRGLLDQGEDGDPGALLALEDLFDGLAGDERFAAEVRTALERITRDGVREAVRAALDAGGATDAGVPSRGGARAGAPGDPAPRGTMAFEAADLRGVRALLCDADGNLFPSEEPAFVASADVTNRFLREHGVDREYGAEELRLATTGMNFRSTAVALAAEHGAAAPEEDRLEWWVAEERRAVAAYLESVLEPDPTVGGPLRRMASDLTLAAVSSSATPRLQACFRATGLEDLFAPERTFSAEDSLPRPTSKPDPAVYLHACERLGLQPGETVAVEDSVPGARSAVAAGCITLGNVQFVSATEREERIAALREAGVVAVVEGWDGVEELLGDGEVRP
jgi:fructuronate reductase/mannitol 2-dehydrogenase